MKYIFVLNIAENYHLSVQVILSKSKHLHDTKSAYTTLFSASSSSDSSGFFALQVSKQNVYVSPTVDKRISIDIHEQLAHTFSSEVDHNIGQVTLEIVMKHGDRV